MHQTFAEVAVLGYQGDAGFWTFPLSGQAKVVLDWTLVRLANNPKQLHRLRIGKAIESSTDRALDNNCLYADKKTANCYQGTAEAIKHFWKSCR